MRYTSAGRRAVLASETRDELSTKELHIGDRREGGGGAFGT